MKRIAIYLLVGIPSALALVLIAAWLTLPFWASGLLSRMLGVPVEIGAVSFRFGSAGVEVADIRIAQPAGFGDEALLAVGRVEVAPEWFSIMRPLTVVRRFAVADARLRLVQNDEGLNLDALFPDRTPDAPENASAPAGDFHSMLVRELELTDIALEYVNYVKYVDRTGDAHETYGARNVSLAVSNLMTGPAGAFPDGASADLKVAAVLFVNDNFVKCRLSATAGSFDGAIPRLTGELELAGLMPELTDAFSLEFLRNWIAGPGADIAVSFQTAPDLISVDFQCLEVDGGALIAKAGITAHLPADEFELRDVWCAQPAGYGDNEMLALRHGRVHPAGDWRQGNVTGINDIVLDGLTVNFLRDARGLLNFNFNAGESAAEYAEYASSADEPLAPAIEQEWDFSIGRVNVTDTSFTFTDLMDVHSPPVARLDDFNFWAESISLGSSAEGMISVIAAMGGGARACDVFGINAGMGWGATNLAYVTGTRKAAEDTVTASLHARIEQAGAPDAELALTLNSGVFGADLPKGMASFALSNFLPHAPTAFFDFDAEHLTGPGSVDLQCNLDFSPGFVRARFELAQTGGRMFARLESGEFSWREGQVQLSNIMLAQPEGYGTDILLAIPHAVLKFDPDLHKDAGLRIKELKLAGPVFNLIKDKEGLLNVQRFVPAPGAEPASDAETVAQEGVGMTVDQLAITNAVIAWHDNALPGEPFSITVRDLHCAGTDLKFGDFTEQDPDIGPGRLTLVGRMDQPLPMTNAPVGIGLKIWSWESGSMPVINAVARITGLELETLRPIMPTGATQVLGGPAADFSAAISLAETVLDARFNVRAVNAAPLTLRIGGTPKQPVLDHSDVLFNLFMRTGGGVGGLARTLAGTGISVVGTTAGTALDIGRTAGGAAWDVGAGLVQTARGAAGGNVTDMTDGLRQATIGAAGRTASGLRDAGTAVIDGTVDTVTLSGGQQRTLRQWRADIPARWDRGWTADIGLLAIMEGLCTISETDKE